MVSVAVLMAKCCDRAGGISAECSQCPLSENLGTPSAMDRSERILLSHM